MTTRIRAGIALAGICAIAISAALGFAVVAKDLGGPGIVALLERGVECDECTETDYLYVVEQDTHYRAFEIPKGDAESASFFLGDPELEAAVPGHYARIECRAFSEQKVAAFGGWTARYCEITRVTREEAEAFYAGAGTEPAA